MSATKEASGLIELVTAIIHKDRGEIAISPAWVATEAMRRLGALYLQHDKPLVYIGCHMHLRQLARGVCRELFEVEDEKEQDHPLFPDLQWRYPIKPNKNEEPQYVLRDLMTDEDGYYNIARLESEGAQKIRHADALRAFILERRRRAAQ